MDKKITNIIMNPARQRIIQFLLINQKGTVSEIAAELSDIPRVSIYRHIKVLLEASLIEVVEEKAIRGTIEKTYSLIASPFGDMPTNDDISLLIQNTLLSIAGNFSQYFKNTNADPQKDMLSVSSSTLMLSDEEFAQFFKEIGEIYNKVINNKPDGKRKPRAITIISAPTTKEKGE